MRFRFLLALGATLLLTACGADITPPTTFARLRVVHALASAPVVDVALDGTVIAAGVAFPASTSFGIIDGGAHTVSLVEPTTGRTIVSSTQEIATNTAFTLIALGDSAAPRFVTVADTFVAPAAGTGAVRFINASTTAGSVDVFLFGIADDDFQPTSPAFTNVGLGGTSPFLLVAAGAVVMGLTSSGTLQTQLVTDPVTLQVGELRTVVGVDAPIGRTPLGFLVLDDRRF